MKDLHRFTLQLIKEHTPPVYLLSRLIAAKKDFDYYMVLLALTETTSKRIWMILTILGKIANRIIKGPGFPGPVDAMRISFTAAEVLSTF